MSRQPVLLLARTVTSIPCTGNREMSVPVEQVGVDVNLPQGSKVHDILTVLESGRVVLCAAN